MLGEALDYPTAGDAGPSSLLLGGLLVGFRTIAIVPVIIFYPLGETAIESWPATAAALGILLVFELPLRGYRIRALRATAGNPAADAPRFRPIGRLFREGFGGLMIYVIYLLPAVLFGLLAVGGNATAAFGNPTDAFARGVARNVAGLAVLFGLLYLVGMVYILPAAVTNYAYERRITAAFNLREVFGGAFSEDYGVAWLISVLFQAVAYPLSLFLWTLLVGPFVQFFAAIATRYLWGYGYGRGRGLGTATPDDTARESTALQSVVERRDASNPDTPTSAGRGADARRNYENDPHGTASRTSTTADTSENEEELDDPMALEFDR